MKKIHLLPLAMLSLMLMIGVVQANPPPQNCEPIWKEILDSVSRASCRDFDNDFACYGHGQLYVSYVQDVSQDQIKAFSSPGDRSPLAVFSQITTTPLDYDTRSYGVSVLRFAAVAPADKEAYLAGTKSGDSVQFILYGDAYLQPNPEESNISTSSDVKTIPRLPGFYFYTGMSSEPLCIDLPQGSLPEGGLLVQSPQGMKVKFTANGANITIGSSVLLQAEPNRTMVISVIEGQALIEVPGYLPMPLRSSQKTTISLGGANGLQAIAAPQVPSTIGTAPPSILSMCQLASLAGFYNPCNTVNTSRPSAPVFTNGQAMMVSASPNAVLRKNASASSVDKTWPVDYGHCVKVNDPKSQWNTSENQYWVQVSTEDKKHSGWVETNSLSKPEDPIATVSKDGNVRSGDDKGFRLITSIRAGDKVTLLGLSTRGTGWYYIRLSNGTEGWISPGLITVPQGICSLGYIRPPNATTTTVKPPEEQTPITVTPTIGIDLLPITIVVPSPQPSFSASNTKMGIICADSAAIMQFHNNSTDAVSYSWNFGDGGTSNEVNPSHAYQAAGAHSGDNYFTVTLYATNQVGATESITLTIAVPFHNLC